MSDVDRSIEGDEPIQQIAEDLNRIKRVAELLRKAQTSVDAVLSASEEVISKAGDFAANSTKILQRLDDVDLDGRLTQIQGGLSDAVTALGNTQRGLTNTIGEASESLETQLSEIKSQLASLTLRHSELGNEMAGRVDKLSKDLEKINRTLDPSFKQIERYQDSLQAKTMETLEATRKQLLYAAGAGIALVVIVIVILILS